MTGDIADRCGAVRDHVEELTALGLDPEQVMVVAAADVQSAAVAARLGLSDGPELARQWAAVMAILFGPVLPQVILDEPAPRSRRKGAAETTIEEPPRDAPAAASQAGPEAEPGTVADAPRTGTEEQRTGTEELVSADDFAAYVYKTEDYSAAKSITFGLSGEHVKLSWPALEADSGQTVVYRVVAANDGEPYSPDASVVAATTQVSLVDRHPSDDPYRHVQVWANVGADLPSAKQAQPTLHARGLMVMPPSNFELRAADGSVTGQWHIKNDLGRKVEAHVKWIPASTSSQMIGFQVGDELPDVVPGGFTHVDPTPGTTLEYRLVARVNVTGGDGQPQRGESPVVSRTVDTPVVIDAVTDLDITFHDDDPSQLDLSWTRPVAGEVAIFRTPFEPPAGIDRHDLIDRGALDNAGLTADRKVVHPPTEEGGTTILRGTRWQRGWAKAYFTPVTIVDENRMRAGAVQVRTRPPETVRHARLVDRVDTKLLSFEWPEGVDMVRVYLTAVGMEFSAESRQPDKEMSAAEYSRRGGLVFTSDVLDDNPVTIHLVSTSYSGGRPIMAKPAALSYPGLCRIEYRIVAPPAASSAGRLPKFGRSAPSHPTLPQLQIKAYSDWDDRQVSFILAHHPKQFPLIRDESTQTVHACDWRPSKESGFSEEINLSPFHGGYLRLFAVLPDSEQRRLAIQDPPIAQLKVP